MRIILSFMFFSLPCFAEVDRTHCIAAIQIDIGDVLPLTKDGRLDLRKIKNGTSQIKTFTLPDDQRNGWVELTPTYRFANIKVLLKEGEVGQIITTDKRTGYLVDDTGAPLPSSISGPGNATLTTIHTFNFSQGGNKCVPTTILEDKITDYRTKGESRQKRVASKIQDVGSCRQLKEFFTKHASPDRFSAKDASDLDQIMAAGAKRSAIDKAILAFPKPSKEHQSYERGKMYLETCYYLPDIKTAIEDDSAWPPGSAIARTGHGENPTPTVNE